MRFRKYCSDLLKLVEGYLAQTTFEMEAFAKPTYLVKAIVQRRYEALYGNTTRKLKQISEKVQERNADYYFHQYNIERNYFNLTDSVLNRSDKNNIELIGANLDNFYIAEKLKFYYSLLVQRFASKFDYQFQFMDEIMHFVETNAVKEIPIIAVYYQMVLTLTQPEVLDNYYKLKQLLRDLALNFPKEEANSMYNAAQNYCIIKVNQGNLEFLEEYFLLTVDILEKGVIIDSQGLEPWKFKNIIIIALRLGKFEWVEEFIENYKSYIPEELRENAVTFNLAQLYFYQKNTTRSSNNYNSSSTKILLIT